MFDHPGTVIGVLAIGLLILALLRSNFRHVDRQRQLIERLAKADVENHAVWEDGWAKCVEYYRAGGPGAGHPLPPNPYAYRHHADITVDLATTTTERLEA
jgi:hypothetical protein